MKKKRILIILLLLLLLVGCKKRHEDQVTISDPNVEYKSTYDGKYGNAGPLQGNTIVVSIITDDQTTKWTNSKTDEKTLNSILDKLSTSTEFLSKCASKYGKKATFVYNWEKYKDLKYKATFSENLLTSGGEGYYVQKKWIQEHINTKALKNKYQADNVIYIFFINTEFQDKIKPWTITHNNCDYCDVEFTNMYYRYDGYAAPAGTFAHEMLHQFGAPDFYYANEYINQKYVDYLSKNDSKDIMYFINKGNGIESKFTDLDAYYAGIAPRPQVANEWNLGKNEYERG